MSNDPRRDQIWVIARSRHTDAEMIQPEPRIRRYAYRWPNFYAEASGFSSDEALAKVHAAAHEAGVADLLNDYGPEERLMYFTTDQSTKIRILP